MSRQSPPRLPDGRGEFLALAGALGLYASAMAGRGERWLWMLRHEGAGIGREDAYGLTIVGYMGNNVLPVRGGDVIRVYLAVQRAAVGYRAVVGTLIAERILDTICLLGLFFLLAVFVLPDIATPDLGTGWIVAAGAVLAAVGLILAIARTYEPARRLLEALRPLAKATRDLRGSYGAAMVAMTVVIWAAEAATFFAVGRGVGIEIAPIEALYLIAIASVFVLIPSGPGYIGTLDAAVLFGMRAIGESGSEAISFLVMLRFVLFVPVTLAGLIMLLTRYGGFGSLRSALRAGEEAA